MLSFQYQKHKSKNPLTNQDILQYFHSTLFVNTFNHIISHHHISNMLPNHTPNISIKIQQSNIHNIQINGNHIHIYIQTTFVNNPSGKTPITLQKLLPVYQYAIQHYNDLIHDIPEYNNRGTLIFRGFHQINIIPTKTYQKKLTLLYTL